jgi:hypothetical protein
LASWPIDRDEGGLTMRPKLRDHVYRLETDEGVMFRGISGTIHLRGERIGPWVEQIVPLLDGVLTKAQILRRLPKDHHPLFKQVLTALIEQGFVYDRDQDRPHTLTEVERSQYRTVIDYLGEWTQDAEARFEQFRRAPVLAVGSGHTFAAAVRGLVQSGVERIDLVSLGPVDVLNHLLTPYGSCSVTIRLLTEAEWAGMHDLDYGMVLYVGPLDAPYLPFLAHACRAGGRPLLIAGVSSAGGFLFPLLRPGGPICFSCLTQMLRHHRIDWDGNGGQSPTLQVLVGAKVSYEWLLMKTGARASKVIDHLIRIDAKSLQESSHQLFPLPGCDDCPIPLDGSVESLIDPVTGYLDQVDPQGMSQLPLAQVAAILPAGLGAGSVVVVAGALDEVTARERALLDGLESSLSLQMGERKPGCFSIGRTAAEWRGRGAMQVVLGQIHHLVADGRWRPTPVTIGANLEAETHRNLKALRLWYSVPVTLVGQELEVAIVVGVLHGEQVLALRAGLTWAHAVHEGITAALQALQNGEPPLGLPPVRLQSGPVHHVDQPTGRDPDWERWAKDRAHLLDARPVSGLPGSLLGGWVDLRGIYSWGVSGYSWPGIPQGSFAANQI